MTSGVNNYQQKNRNGQGDGTGRWEIFGLIFYPLLFYQMLSVLLIILGRAIVADGAAEYMLCQTLMAVVSIPVMYLFFLRPDLRNFGTKYYADFTQQNNSAREILISRGTVGVSAFRKIALCVLIILLIGTGLNNLILMSPLAGMSAGYAQASEDFYAGGMLLELICSGILMPVLEELVYRGILHGRMRRFLGAGKACLLSAVVFGIMHFNLVQFVFGFCMGILFALLLEKTGKLYCVIAAHMAVNLLAVIRTETGFLSTTADASLFAWVTSVAFLLLGLAFLYYYAGGMMKEIRQMMEWESANANRAKHAK